MSTVLTRRDLEAAQRVKAATLSELGVVSVCVAPGDEIFGHSHTLIDEVVIVHKGKGCIQIDDQTSDVCKGSVATIPAGKFHVLCNTGKKNLEATVVYNTNVERDKVDFKDREQHFAVDTPTLEDLCAEIKSLKKAYKKLKKSKK